jgi:hypothetical protein
MSQHKLERARAALKDAEARIGVNAHVGRTLPVATGLEALVGEGLRCGHVIAVGGSTSLMLALAAEASKAGSWVAAVGMPTVGVVAAARRGLELSRLALIPHPGAQAAQVTGQCVDGMDVVLLGAALALSDADRRRLASRAKERGSLVIASGQWPRAQTTLVVEQSSWAGLGAGDGRLRSRELTVAVHEKGGVRRVRLVLDADPGLTWLRPGARLGVEEVA